MQKTHRIALLALLCSTSSFQIQAECLFGENLVATSRYRDLVASEQTTYQKGDVLSAEQIEKIRMAMSIKDAEVDVFEMAGSDASFWVRILTDTHTGKAYDMILSDPGGNVAGGIIDGDKLAASIGDGDIGECIESVDYSRNQFFKHGPGAVQKEANIGGYFGRSLGEMERISQFTIKASVGDAARYQAKYEVSDRFSKTTFYLDVDDNGNGSIVTSEAPFFRVARVLNGNLVEQASGFDLYQKLPWFYSN